MEVVRGDDKGEEGIVSRVDREEEKVYVNGIEAQKIDGSTREKPLRASNLQVQALNIDDDARLEKYEIEDVESIGVEAEEMEEALEEDEEKEMMKRMQAGEEAEEEDLEEDEEESEQEETEEKEETAESEEEQTEETTTDYEEIVSNTISDAKEQLKDIENVDWKKVIEAEKNNKNRKTFKQWLETRED